MIVTVSGVKLATVTMIATMYVCMLTMSVTSVDSNFDCYCLMLTIQD
jgi:hypothetical protein